ncbi:MAG: hypothetical protein AAGI91_09815 [Bacteroidota bacterium]
MRQAEPAAPATVEVPFERQPGERGTLRVTKTLAEREDGLLADSLSGAWLVETRVLAARPRGYTLAWTYRAEDTGAAPGSLARRAIRFDLRTNTLEGVPIVFRTDRTGQPYEIANGDSLRAALDRALRRLAPRLAPEQRPALDVVRATAATDDGLENLLLADAERFYLASGGRYPPGRALTSRSLLPNPFGGAPIPAVTSFRLSTPAAADSVLTVRWQQTPDAGALARVIINLLREVAPGSPRLSPDEIAQRFGVEEEATYRVEQRRGTVLGVDYRKTVRFGGRLRTERTAMEALPKRTPG